MNARVIMIIALSAAYVLVRVWRLDATCLWFDEMYSVHAAEHPWSAILPFVGMDLVHPPLFYLLLKVWILIGGDSVYWLRMLPVVFSALAIAPFILLARELKLSGGARVFALFLLAINGSLIKYTQEVRMYTMLMFVSFCSIWLFARQFNRRKSWLALVLINTVLVYTHYYGWLIVGAQVGAVLMFQRSNLRRISGMAAIVLAAFLPWMIYVLRHASTGLSVGENIDWIRRPTVPIFLNFCLDLIEPFFFQASSLEPVSIYRVSLPIVLIIIAAVVLYFATKPGVLPSGVKLLAWFSALPLAAALVASWLLPYSVWGTRHMIIIVGPVMLLIASMITSISITRARAGILTFFLLLAGYALALEVRRPAPEYVWCGWAPLIQGAGSSAGAINVYTSENLAAYHAWFATRTDSRYLINIVRAQEPSKVDKEYFPPRGNDKIKFVAVDEIKEPNIVLIYRTEPALSDWLRHDLEMLGYKSCSPIVRDFGPSSAVRLEMTHGLANCIFP